MSQSLSAGSPSATDAAAEPEKKPKRSRRKSSAAADAPPAPKSEPETKPRSSRRKSSAAADAPQAVEQPKPRRKKTTPKETPSPAEQPKPKPKRGGTGSSQRRKPAGAPAPRPSTPKPSAPDWTPTPPALPKWLDRIADGLKSAVQGVLPTSALQQQGINDILKEVFRDPPLLRDILRRNGLSPAQVDRILEEQHPAFLREVAINLSNWANSGEARAEGVPMLIEANRVLGPNSADLESLFDEEQANRSDVQRYRERAAHFLRSGRARQDVEKCVVEAGRALLARIS